MDSVDCTEARRALGAQVVENAPWQIRAKRAGLSQKELASFLGVTENTISHQLRGLWGDGVPLSVRSFIMAWEKLSQPLKNELREDIKREREVRKD